MGGIAINPVRALLESLCIEIHRVKHQYCQPYTCRLDKIVDFSSWHLILRTTMMERLGERYDCICYVLLILKGMLINSRLRW